MSNDFDDVITKIVKTYKITREDAYDLLNSQINKNKQLLELIQHNPDKVRKTRIFKDFIKNLRKDIYYKLRQYKPLNHNVSNTDLSTEAILNVHISTKERLPYKKEWENILVEKFGDTETILDLGGGVFPLMFPFEKFVKLKNYVWVDKDKWAHDILQKQQENIPNVYSQKLKLYNLDISELDISLLKNRYGIFDLVLMLKLISVVQRQEESLLSLLADVTRSDFTKKVFITSSKEAMTKHKDISARENKTLINFIKLADRNNIEKIDLTNEFGYILS